MNEKLTSISNIFEMFINAFIDVNMSYIMAKVRKEIIRKHKDIVSEIKKEIERVEYEERVNKLWEHRQQLLRESQN